ncbi:hypothetical protein HOB87_13510 [Candidatus Woesearchaeota archaeon]|nr:hypothetical protein [Candidatus Woesearchaeota archaeon]MBT7558099.1 hypothetical protein [Candidatus Woesearchaeota archaeon]
MNYSKVSKNNKKNDSLVQSYIVLSISESFENMMDIAELNHSINYDTYSDFEEDFYSNLEAWESTYVDILYSNFIKEFHDRCGCNIFEKLTYEGRFYEQVDYVFIFTLKITGQYLNLKDIVNYLTVWECSDKEDFSIVINDMKNYFRPSYSGEDKREVWKGLNVTGIYWPPRVLLNNGAK